MHFIFPKIVEIINLSRSRLFVIDRGQETGDSSVQSHAHLRDQGAGGSLFPRVEGPGVVRTG